MAKTALESMGHKLVEWKGSDKGKLIEEGLLVYMKTLSADGAVTLKKDLNDDLEISYPNALSGRLLQLPNWLKTVVAFAARPILGDLPSQAIFQMREVDHPHGLNEVYKQILTFQKKFADEYRAHGFDALLWPSFPCPAVPVDLPREMLGSVSYTALFNLLDWPAGVTPVTKVEADDCQNLVGFDKDMFHRTIKVANETSDAIGLPVAIQIAAPRYCEETVLRLMSEVESKLKI